MKELCLFLLLLVVIKVGESNEPAADPSKVKYHGSRRYWTSVDSNGKTYISLNALKEAVSEPVKLEVPQEKNIGQILSDMILFSPTKSEDACKADNSNLEFKLVFDNENWIRGQVILKGESKIVTALLYAKCPREDGTLNYAINRIDSNEASFEAPERTCFTSTNPLHSSDDTANNVMELQVTSTFKCNVFVILPEYMAVEDEKLESATREPLNETFAEQGEGFWWKDGNNASLSDGISFDERDVVINITNLTKSIPYFLRIGKDPPYPSLNFEFDLACSDQQYDLIVNLRDSDECRLRLALTEMGIMVTAKGVPTEISDATKSPTFVFARGQSKVYVKAGTHLAVVPMDVCQIENSPDVPADQFVLQLGPSEGSSVCNHAQVILPADDVGKIEVLLDRVKAAKLIAEFGLNQNGTTEATSNSTIAAPAHTTTKSEEAGLLWLWIVLGLLLSFVFIGILVVVVCCIHRRRRKQKEQKKCQRTKSPVRAGRKAERKADKFERAQTVKTAIPVNEQPPKKAPPPSPKKPTQELPLQPTQEETADSVQNPVMPIFDKIEREKMERRKPFRDMYGPGGFVNMNDEFDYHENESPTFDTDVDYETIYRTPWNTLKRNFWTCIDHLCTRKNYGEGGIFFNSMAPGNNIVFYVHDCVRDIDVFAPFRSLSTRINQPIYRSSFAHRGDGKARVVAVRVFILSYQPITIELHCRGKCPKFLFGFMDCEECLEIGRKLKEDPTAATCRESWETFVCRVKQTPFNSHQFLSYNGPDAIVKKADDINYMLVIRGDKKPNQLRPCSHRCTFEDASHPNPFIFKADRPNYLGEITVETQTTQASTQ